MRIFYAADHILPSGTNVWHNNLYLPLVDIGHEVIPFAYNLTPHFQNANPRDPGRKEFIQKHRPRLEEALLRQIRQAHRFKPIDVFFSYFPSALCRPQVILEIRAMGICTINWYCNASYQFELVEEIAPAYDYCLVPEKSRLDDYRRVGAKPIYCQEAANPNIYKPYNIPQSFDVTFVGQKYGDRPAYIRALLDAGIDVRVWGPSWKASGPVQRLKKLTTVDGWRRAMRKVARKMDELSSEESNVDIPRAICGPALNDEDLIKMYSRSKISLGFSSCGETHEAGQRILQVRLRDFEAPMSGAFYMVEYMEELEEFYQIGEEIVCYHDKEDLANKARYYLMHDVERERIRWAGYQRAVNDHSWQKRFEYVFRKIGLTQ